MSDEHRVSIAVAAAGAGTHVETRVEVLVTEDQLVRQDGTIRVNAPGLRLTFPVALLGTLFPRGIPAAQDLSLPSRTSAERC